MLVWHWRAVTKADLAPDVLALLLPHDRLFEAGAAHVAFTAYQCGPFLRIEFLAQNLFDGDSHLLMSIFPKWGQQALAAFAPPIDWAIGPSAVVCATLNLPIQPLAAAVPLRLALSGGARRLGGKRVRFRRRPVVGSPAANLPLIAVADGLWNAGPGTFLDLVLHAVPPEAQVAAPVAPVQWRFETVWSPRDPALPDEIRARVQADRPVSL
jgi:hypothetical protein